MKQKSQQMQMDHSLLLRDRYRMAIGSSRSIGSILEKIDPYIHISIYIFLTRYAMNNGWQKIDIQCCYSSVKINFAPICICMNNPFCKDVSHSVIRIGPCHEPYAHHMKPCCIVLSPCAFSSGNWLSKWHIHKTGSILKIMASMVWSSC